MSRARLSSARERAPAAGALRVAVALAACVAGCRGAPDPAALEMWALGREGEVVQRMIPEFERTHPGLRVRVQQIPWSAAHEKILTAFVGESMPDVFQVGNTWIPELATLDAVLPLDELAAASATTRLDDWFPGILDTNVVDGRLRAIPWYVDTRLLFFRTDLVAAAGYPGAPRDWPAWLAAMTALREVGGRHGFAILLPLTEWQPLVALAFARGAELLRDDDTRGNFATPEFREAFHFYVDLFRRGLAPVAGPSAIANLYQEFGRGTFAFYVSGPWNVGEFRARLPEAVSDDWTTAPLPPARGEGPGTSLAGGASLAVFRGSPRREAAWKLVEWLSEPAQQLELWRLTGDLPARRSAWTEDGPAGDRQTAAFRVQLEHVRATPKIPEWERIADTIARHAERAVRGEASIDDALARLGFEVDDLLEKRRWRIERAAGSAS